MEPGWRVAIWIVVALVVLGGIALVTWWLFQVTNPAVATDARTATTVKPHFLSVLAIAKNEALIVRDWLDHYHAQGIDHVYLIDNGSTDDMVANIEDWDAGRGWVTVETRTARNAQADHYNHVYQAQARHESEWLAVLDLDEYLWGVQLPLAEYLRTHAPAPYIEVAWTVFGSSGHNAHPRGQRLVDAFVHRAPTVSENVKAVFRTELVDHLDLHRHRRTGGARVHMDRLDHPDVRLYHYPILSWEYFESVKMTRGDAENAAHNTLRDRVYFDRYDMPCTVLDRSLSVLGRDIQ